MNNMEDADIVIRAVRALPTDVAVLCADCATAVPLRMFVESGPPKRQVRCPACACDVVLRDAW
jgi:DNA-directed RNA polymerase subunit RPC12/RpoP